MNEHLKHQFVLNLLYMELRHHVRARGVLTFRETRVKCLCEVFMTDRMGKNGDGYHNFFILNCVITAQIRIFLGPEASR